MKGIELLKREIHKELESWHGVEGGIDGDGINEIMILVNQLYEPEVLSQEGNINIVLDDLKEHIKEQQSLSQNVGLAHTSAGNDTHYRQYDYVLECINEYEPSDGLQNLLVPKPELPVIPKIVAGWYESAGKHANWWNWIYKWGRRNPTGDEEEVYKWFTNYNEELFVDMFRYGYEVETEQKYYVMSNDQRMMLVRMMDGKTITEADPFKLEDMYEVEKKSHRLTEQEIKDYDTRYFAFAVKVEEVG